MQPVALKDGTVIYFETSAGGDFSAQGMDDKVTTRLEDVSTNLSKVVGELAEKFQQGWDKIRPDEFEIELGATLSGEGSIVISKVKVEANITVKATWKSPSATKS